MLSKACEYGIRSMIFIALHSKNGDMVGLKDIAKETHSPEHFVAKILQQLAKKKIISSAKGPNGGFSIDPDKHGAITLAMIITAIDGSDIMNKCIMGLNDCSEIMPCPVHNQYKGVRSKLNMMFNSCTLQEMISSYKDGTTHLKS